MITNENMIHILSVFYAEYLAWAEGRSPNLVGFVENKGLCANARQWAKSRGYGAYIGMKMEEFQESMFTEANLSPHYPFGGHEQYTFDKEHNNMARNEKRLEWCRNHLPEGEQHEQ